MEYKINDEITFDDGKVYTVIDSVIYNDKKYVYLGYQDNNEESHFVILREDNEDGEYYLVNLDSDEEFDNVMSLISKNAYDFIKEGND